MIISLSWATVSSIERRRKADSISAAELIWQQLPNGSEGDMAV